MDSRYFATVRRATTMPCWPRISVIWLSDSGFFAFSAPTSCLINARIAQLEEGGDTSGSEAAPAATEEAAPAAEAAEAPVDEAVAEEAPAEEAPAEEAAAEEVPTEEVVAEADADETVAEATEETPEA